MRSNTRGKARRLATSLSVVPILLLLGAPSHAANRFAEPNGDGLPPCAAGDPCEIGTAVGGAASGDDVTLLPGTYVVSTPIAFPAAITVHGAPGARPVIQTTAPVGVSVLGVTAVLRDVDIEHDSASGTALYLPSGTAERVSAHTTTGLTACAADDNTVLTNATLRDSVCWNTNPLETQAVDVEASGPTVGVTLRNVTAIDADPASYGIRAIGGGGTGPFVTATNVIADGGAFDVAAVAGSGDSAIVSLDHSNYSSESEGGGGTATVTNPGTGTNVSAAPAFASKASGDFHQLPSSSATIDLGVAGFGLGALDLDGQARANGSAPDIGADEFHAAPPGAGQPTPTAKKTKCKKKRKKRSASASKRCKR